MAGKRRGTERYYKPSPPGVSDDLAELLFVEWTYFLAGERLNMTQTGTGSDPSGRRSYHARSEDGELRLVAQRSGCSVEVSGNVGADEAHALVRDALDATNRLDTGEDVVYVETLRSPKPGGQAFGRDFGTQFMRLVGNNIRITGRRCLGPFAVLDFVEELNAADATPILFAPDTNITVAAFVPGPSAGPFSDGVAWDLLETVRVVCSFAMGRPVDGSPHVFAATDEVVIEQAKADRADPDILELARNGVAISPFRGRGYAVLTDRLRSSLVAHDAALRQENSDAAVMLFVAGLEALVAPPTQWSRRRNVKRFISALEELCPDEVDEVVRHANVEDALVIRLRGGTRKRRRQVLDRVYELRSLPVHGTWGRQPPFMQALGHASSMRSALLSDIYLGAMLHFLQAPRSFLWGHPKVDPDPTDE